MDREILTLEYSYTKICAHSPQTNKKSKQITLRNPYIITYCLLLISKFKISI